MEVSSQLRAAVLCPRVITPGAYWIGSWVDPSFDLDAMKERRKVTLQGFKSLSSNLLPVAIPTELSRLLLPY
jgi:hypothetical protein